MFITNDRSLYTLQFVFQLPPNSTNKLFVIRADQSKRWSLASPWLLPTPVISKIIQTSLHNMEHVNLWQGPHIVYICNKEQQHILVRPWSSVASNERLLFCNLSNLVCYAIWNLCMIQLPFWSSAKLSRLIRICSKIIGQRPCLLPTTGDWSELVLLLTFTVCSMDNTRLNSQIGSPF